MSTENQRYYAHFADELPALEYKDNAFDAWAEIDSRREFEPQFKDSTIFVKCVTPAKISDFLPTPSQLLGLMRERMVELIGNDDAIDNMHPDLGNDNAQFGEHLPAALEGFGMGLDAFCAKIGFRIDGDIVVKEQHFRPGEHP